MLARAARRLEAELGRGATEDELAEATALPVQSVHEALTAAHVTASLNQDVGTDEESELANLLADRGAVDPFEEAAESLRRQGVRDALGALPERERLILELRFGFEGEPRSLEEIGRELEVSRERVRRLLESAVKRLRAQLDAPSIHARVSNMASAA
jgi:RNA polymerase primary sigma factor